MWFLARRRTMAKSEGGGEDWSEAWLGKEYAALCREYGLQAIGDLTLDQYDWLCSDGEADQGGQFDIEKRRTEFLENELPRIKAAMEAGTVEAFKEEEPPAVIKMAMDRGLIEELPPSTR